MRTSKIKLALGALASIAPGVATAQTPLTYSGGPLGDTGVHASSTHEGSPEEKIRHLGGLRVYGCNRN